MKLEYAFFAFLGFIALSMVFQVAKNGGFRGFMFGAPILETVGAMDLGRRGMAKTKLKVLRLAAASAESPTVGIEVTSYTVGAFSVSPLPLTRTQAQELSILLARAAGDGA